MNTTQFYDKIKKFFKDVNDIYRGKATDVLEWETGELENIFALLVFGTFVEIPSPPIHITMELLPEMEKELNLMIDKVCTAHDPLGDLFSVLDVN